MSTKEFFASRLASELPAFNKVIRALPTERLDYRPHERSASAGGLAFQLVQEMEHLSALFETGEIHFELGKPEGTSNDLADAIQRHGEAALERLKNVGEDHWEAPAKFYMDGKVVWETTVSGMAWGYIFDMVHHRGQLSSYIRPMGGKVPAIYGPSADEQS